ncbi:MAG: PEP-CTERM sorting domain-containing protein [Akkermansiaceae bacterium]|nr:PEP-CTERM sorting domain-containing protein [Akkermansiaceae bacterium]
MEIPVQVIRCGKTPEWVYVQISPQAVPEPGTLSLLGIGAILLMIRRQRP